MVYGWFYSCVSTVGNNRQHPWIWHPISIQPYANCIKGTWSNTHLFTHILRCDVFMSEVISRCSTFSAQFFTSAPAAHHSVTQYGSRQRWHPLQVGCQGWMARSAQPLHLTSCLLSTHVREMERSWLLCAEGLFNHSDRGCRDELKMKFTHSLFFKHQMRRHFV